MSNQNNSVISVNDLVVTLHGDGGNDRDIHYGSFEIYPGDFVLVKGRNGSGKSTFLRLFHLQGTHYFTVKSGAIRFHGEGFPETSIEKYSESELTHLNRAISFIGQEERFLSNDSAYSYIYETCRIALSGNHEFTPAQRRERLQRVDEMIYEYYEKYLAKSFECKKYKTFKNKSARAWSGGQQKMINVLAGVIKARICGLKLVLMDEPLNNLDGKNKDILNKLITELRQSNVAILTITHCQIFDGVNKVLLLTENEDGTRYAKLLDRAEPAHVECLEAYN
jgi:ABC-type lipoprotein export system ATPase subunit